MKKKNNQLSTDVGAREKLAGSKMGTFGWRVYKPNQAFINNVCEKLLDYIFNYPKPYTFERFYFINGYDEDTYAKWRKEWPQLQRTHDLVKLGIAALREERNAEGQWPTPTFMFAQPNYSNTWKELTEWRTKLAEKIEEKRKPTNVTIVMDDFGRQLIASGTEDTSEQVQTKALPTQTLRRP